MALIDRYLQLAIAQKASDIHFASGQPVNMRVHGDLIPLDEKAKSSGELEANLLELMTEIEREKFAEQKNLDKSYIAAGIGNFRVNVFQTRNGIAAVLRAIPTRIPTMTDLGLPDVVQSLTELGKGLVLVTGPTGSGKSTTLAAMINHINQNFPHHILTAEDPVEFVHNSQQSLINQREIGSSCLTFADALKYALREDPDVILVGEMRDLETIALALTAAETGHLVFGTLHTRGAAASIDRIIDSFPGNQQAMIRTMLAESLAAVISQSLLKKADGTGRVAAYEIMVVNHAISNLIREGKSFQIPSIIQTARKEGMMLMDQHIRELVNKGTVSRDEAALYMVEGGSPIAAKKTGNIAGNARPTPIKTNFAASPAARPSSPTPSPGPVPGKPGAPPAMRPGAPPAGARPPTFGNPPPRVAPPPAAAPEPSQSLPDADELSELGEGEEGSYHLDAEGLEELTGTFESSKQAPPAPPAKPRMPTPITGRPGQPPAAPVKATHLPPPPTIGKKKVG